MTPPEPSRSAQCPGQTSVTTGTKRGGRGRAKLLFVANNQHQGTQPHTSAVFPKTQHVAFPPKLPRRELLETADAKL